MFRNTNETDDGVKQITIYNPKTIGLIQATSGKDLSYAGGLTLSNTQYWYKRLKD